MATSARILMASFLMLALAGCSGRNAATACHTASQCLEDWRWHHDQPALDWLQANPGHSRRLAIKLLLSSNYRDRDLGVWLVNLAALDDDAAIHRIVAASLEQGPEAARLHRTPQEFLPSLDRTLTLVQRAMPRDFGYADLAGRFGMQAVDVLERRLRCRPACARLDPMQASAILSAVRLRALSPSSTHGAGDDPYGEAVVAPIVRVFEDERASDSARLDAGLLLSYRMWRHGGYVMKASTADMLGRLLQHGTPAERRDAIRVAASLAAPADAMDWRLVATEMDAQRVPLEMLPLHVAADVLRQGPLQDLLLRRLSDEDTREASMALRVLSDVGSRHVRDSGHFRPLVHSPDPSLAAQAARSMRDTGMSPGDIDRVMAWHWFPAASVMADAGIPSRDRYRAIRNLSCRTKAQRLASVAVRDTADRSLLRLASRRLRTDVADAVENGDTVVASVFRGEFGGYLAVLRSGQPPEIIGHEPFGPLLHLDGDRFLVTSGVAHMDSLAGNVYELHVGPESSVLTHRLGELSEPLALEKQRGRVLLSTYAFGVMDLTDLSAPRWLGCQRPPVDPIRQ